MCGAAGVAAAPDCCPRYFSRCSPLAHPPPAAAGCTALAAAVVAAAAAYFSVRWLKGVLEAALRRISFRKFSLSRSFASCSWVQWGARLESRSESPCSRIDLLPRRSLSTSAVPRLPVGGDGPALRPCEDTNEPAHRPKRKHVYRRGAQVQTRHGTQELARIFPGRAQVAYGMARPGGHVPQKIPLAAPA